MNLSPILSPIHPFFILDISLFSFFSNLWFHDIFSAWIFIQKYRYFIAKYSAKIYGYTRYAIYLSLKYRCSNIKASNNKKKKNVSLHPEIRRGKGKRKKKRRKKLIKEIISFLSKSGAERISWNGKYFTEFK